jgi:hypothetical protein
MPIALAVNKDRAAEIETILAMSDSELGELRMPHKLFERLGDKVVRNLVSLRRFADDRKANSEDVVNALEEGLRKFGWDESKR